MFSIKFLIFLVKAWIEKKKSGDKTLVLAHRIIFGRPGEAGKRKGDLRTFSGLPSSDVTVDKRLSGQTVASLRDLCIMVNLERSGEKNTLVERLEGFLKDPKDFGKSKAVTVKKTATKRKSPTKGKTSKKAATGKKGEKDELSADLIQTDDEDFAEEIADLKAQVQE